MTDIGNEAGEILDHGYTHFVKADLGSFTAQTRVYDGGLVHEDNTDSHPAARRVGTYGTDIQPNDPVKVKTGVDKDDVHVERVAAGDNGNLLYGLYVKWRGQAGDTEHDATVYVLKPGDVLVFEAGSEVDSTNITPGDSVSFSSDSIASDPDSVNHRLKVQADNTNGFGDAINQVTSSGENVKVRVTSHPTY